MQPFYDGAMYRSMLYVPADRPKMLVKAAQRGADLILIDVEDAVPMASKEPARVAAVAAIISLKEQGARVGVRVNSVESELIPDLAAFAGSNVDVIMVAKATKRLIERVAGSTDLDLVALIESGDGLLDARAIAEHPAVVRLAVGEADLAADLGMTLPDHDEAWIPSRARLVWASAAAGLPGPIGGVHIDIPDLDGLLRSTRRLAAMGYAGRSAIHPAQVPVINEVFTPTPEELEDARDLVAAYDEALAAGIGVITDERGAIVDEALVRRSRQLTADPPEL